MRSETDNNAVARWLRRDALRDRVAESLSALASKVDAAAVEVAFQPLPGASPHAADQPRVWAWGQYLNDPSGNQQTGLFGTAAAVEIIRLGNGGLSDRCRTALGTLPFSPDVPLDQIARQQKDYALAKGDTRTTFRVAALVHAWAQMGRAGEDTTSLDDAVNQLLNLRIPGVGWNDSSNGQHLRNTLFHPTAVALYALSAAGKLDPTVAGEAMAPLHPLTAPDPGIAVWSLISLALDDISTTEPRPVEMLDAIHRAHAMIKAWVREADPKNADAAIDGYDFESAEADPGGQGKRYAFMFYMPHCLAALAILRSKELSRGPARAYARRVVQKYQGQLQKSPLVRPRGRSRDSTVEMLWVARLFRAYLDQPRPSTDLGLLALRIGDPIRSLRLWRRLGSVVAVGATTFLAVFAGLFAANTITDNTLSEGLGVLVSIFASVLSSILAAVIIDGQGDR